MGDTVDAVTVSTPDHMHFHAALQAIRMGKHVYVQKPLTHSIWEARTLTVEAAKHKVVTQMGNQAHAGEPIRRAASCRYYWQGLRCTLGPIDRLAAGCH